MSLEQAIHIFTEQGFRKADAAVDRITRAQSLDELRVLMKADITLSADQFVQQAISPLFKGDTEFARKVLDDARALFAHYGLPDEVLTLYVSHGGGVGTLQAVMGFIDLGRLPHVEEQKLRDFSSAADRYLFDCLKGYIT